MADRKDFSQENARIIDEEVKRIIQKMEGKAEELLKSNHSKLDALVEGLLDNESLFKDEIDEILEVGANSGAEYDNNRKSGVA
jgi:cell division protease FtsH